MGSFHWLGGCRLGISSLVLVWVLGSALCRQFVVTFWSAPPTWADLYWKTWVWLGASSGVKGGEECVEGLCTTRWAVVSVAPREGSFLATIFLLYFFYLWMRRISFPQQVRAEGWWFKRRISQLLLAPHLSQLLLAPHLRFLGPHLILSLVDEF